MEIDIKYLIVTIFIIIVFICFAEKIGYINALFFYLFTVILIIYLKDF